MKIGYLILPTIMAAAAALLGCQTSPGALVTSMPSLQRGSICVTVNGIPKRAVQATLADIDHLIVGVQTTDSMATRSIASGSLMNGGASASVTFPALKPGSATVSVEVFDDASSSIGLATASATVEALSVAHLNVDLTLAPSLDLRGNLALSISIRDGATTYSTPAPELLLVSTYAGIGTEGLLDGATSSAQFKYPSGLACDSDGNLFVADFNNSVIRKISSAGIVSTYAGTGDWGFSDGATSSAQFNYPYALACDSNGNLFVADTGNNLIRKISKDGVVSTYAGSGIPGFSDGATSSAQFSSPYGLAFDANGDLFVADRYNNRIRKISKDGVVSTYAGSGDWGLLNGSASSAQFRYPGGLTFDARGNLYVSDSSNHQIRKITPAGNVSTYAGTGDWGLLDGATSSAQFNYPFGLAFDASGNLCVADSSNRRIRKITPAGNVSTYAGSGGWGFSGGSANSAQFKHPFGLAFDANGDLFVSDSENNAILKIVP